MITARGGGWVVVRSPPVVVGGWWWLVGWVAVGVRVAVVGVWVAALC